MHVLFFSASPEHRKTLGRTEGLAAIGATSSVAGYTRPSESDARLATRFHSLGVVKHGARLSRLLAFPLYIWRAIRFARAQQPCDCIWANTLDTLVLALIARPFAKGARRIVYDVADLTDAQLAGGPRGALIRFLDRIACKRIDVIVLTSPWFYWRYYQKLLPPTAPAFLLENKLTPPAPPAPERARGKPWRIVWHGRLRSPTSFAIARAVAAALPEEIEIRAWGHADGDMLADLQAASRDLGNFSYHGAYSDGAIAPVFEGAHFLFAFDLDDGENSMLLLPNRLYHGVARAIPMLAPNETAVGRVIAGLHLGAAFEAPYVEAMIAWLRSLDETTYAALCAPFTDVRRASAVYSDDFRHVAEAIVGGSGGRRIPVQEQLDVVLSP
jgi:hypothetical protein